MAAGGAPAETVAQPEPSYGDVPADIFKNALRAATGGALEDPAAINELLKLRDRHQETVSELEQFRAKAAIKPFASDFVERMNALVEAGTSPDRIQQFVNLSMTEVDKIPPYQALHMATAMQKPHFSPSEVAAFIEDTYGVTPETDVNNLPGNIAYKVKDALVAASNYLNQERVALGELKAEQVNLQRQEFTTQAVGAWKEILPSLSPKIAFAVKDDARGIDYNLDYTIPKEVAAQAHAMTLQTIAQNPEAYPRTQQGLQLVREVYDRWANLLDRENIYKALAFDMHAKAYSEAAAKYGGPIPNRTTQQNPTRTAQSNRVVDDMKLVGK